METRLTAFVIADLVPSRTPIVCSNLRSIPANRCATEQSAVGFRAIHEPKRAPGAGTALHERGLLARDQRVALASR